MKKSGIKHKKQKNIILHRSPVPGPRSGLSSVPAPLGCRCLGSASRRRLAPAPSTGSWWRWSWCAAASSSRSGRKGPRKTCRELREKIYINALKWPKSENGVTDVYSGAINYPCVKETGPASSWNFKIKEVLNNVFRKSVNKWQTSVSGFSQEPSGTVGLVTDSVRGPTGQIYNEVLKEQYPGISRL